MRDAVCRLPLIWMISPSVTPSSAIAERGMRAMPPPLSSAREFATCSFTCFSFTAASATARLPQKAHTAKHRLSSPIRDPGPPSSYDETTEHKSNHQSPTRRSYAASCLKKKKKKTDHPNNKSH